jgi:hypothetical protein
MTKRVCAEPGCPKIQDETRCAKHRRERDQARGTRQQRGYDSRYNAIGRSYQARMDAGQRFNCWRCGNALGTRRGTEWQLGHCDNDRTVIHGPECPGCNLATASRQGQRCPHVSHR